MKKVIFLLAGSMSFWFISCTSIKECSEMSFGDDYYRDSFVMKYKSLPNFIGPDTACTYIHNFKKHKYRGLRKNRLNVSISNFDLKDLQEKINGDDVDYVNFFLAAFTKDVRKGNDSLIGYPFVLIQLVQRATAILPTAGMGNISGAPRRTVVYLLPRDICPPPETGCRAMQLE